MQAYQSEGCGLSIGRISNTAIPPLATQLYCDRPLFLGQLSVLPEDTFYVTLVLITFFLSGRDGFIVGRESSLAVGASGTSWYGIECLAFSTIM